MTYKRIHSNDCVFHGNWHRRCSLTLPDDKQIDRPNEYADSRRADLAGFIRAEHAMLVLSRKVGEKLQIGDGITVIVTRIAGNRVTLGVTAPKDVRIVRSELKPLSELALLRRTEYVVREPGPVTVDVSCDGVTLMAARRAR